MSDAWPVNKGKGLENPDYEPSIHSHVEDGLPYNHAWAFDHISCPVCDALIHAGNNECMTTWLEWNGLAVCIKCASVFFTKHSGGVLEWEEFKQFVMAGKYFTGAKQ